MATDLTAAAVVALPVAVVAVTYLAYRVGRLKADKEYVLTDVDADDSPGHYVFVATVKFDATGNTDVFVIVDDDDLTPHQARRTVEDNVAGADVLEIDRHRLYAYPKRSDVVDV